MALHRETTFKKTRSQYLTDHSTLLGQPCAMRPTSLERRHGKGKGWDGKQHRPRQKCLKPCYRNSEMLISKSMSEAESQPTRYSTWEINFLPLLWFFTILFNPSIVSVSVGHDIPGGAQSWNMSLQSDLYTSSLWILPSISVYNRAKRQELDIQRSQKAKQRNST